MAIGTYSIGVHIFFQQYCVDQYIKIKTDQLRFIKDHQAEIRTEHFSGVVDALEKGVSEGKDVGKKIYLPATFIGGPRNMKSKYLNVVALVQHYGQPSLLITVTCNAKWPEITLALFSGQTSAD